MSVRSARVQEVVVGDDVTLLHQIVGKATLDANETLDSIEVNSGDVVTAFYEAEPDANGAALPDVSQLASPEGDLPTSRITVTLPRAKSVLCKRCLGATVRVEIIRDTSLKKETYYLFNEVDFLPRGFPTEAQTLNLP